MLTADGEIGVFVYSSKCLEVIQINHVTSLAAKDRRVLQGHANEVHESLQRYKGDYVRRAERTFTRPKCSGFELPRGLKQPLTVPHERNRRTHL